MTCNTDPDIADSIYNARNHKKCREVQNCLARHISVAAKYEFSLHKEINYFAYPKRYKECNKICHPALLFARAYYIPRKFYSENIQLKVWKTNCSTTHEAENRL